MSLDSRIAASRAATAQRATPVQPSVDREREQQREEQYRKDIENSLQTATAVVTETLAAEREALAEQQEFLALQAMIIEASKVALPGKILAPTEANQNLLVSMLNPGEVATVELLTAILRQYAGRFSWQVATTPKQRKQQDQQQQVENLQVFAEAARKYAFAEIEANFNVLHGALGDFDIYQVGQAIQSNAVMLAPATESDRRRWAVERAEQRNDFLQNKATMPELRRIANQEFAQTRAAAVHAQADEQLAAQKAQDQYLGFKVMPGEITYDTIKKADREQYRKWMRSYGPSQITERIRQSK